MLYYLAANKSIQDRLRKEINENIGKDDRIDFDVLNDLPYLDQVFLGITNRLLCELKFLKKDLWVLRISFSQRYIKKLSFLLIQLETLRINPPAGVSSKVCTNSTELKDYNGTIVPIAKGTTVQIPIYCFHHDERFYKEPETFNPDRFSEDNGGIKAYRDMGVFLGFLDGPRQCLGKIIQ